MQWPLRPWQPRRSPAVPAPAPPLQAALQARAAPQAPAIHRAVQVHPAPPVLVVLLRAVLLAQAVQALAGSAQVIN